MTRLPDFSARRVRGVCLVLLAAVALIWLVARFVKLNDSPAAFWTDEAWDAAQAMCLAETGHDVNGRGWQLFEAQRHPGRLLD